MTPRAESGLTAARCVKPRVGQSGYSPTAFGHYAFNGENSKSDLPRKKGQTGRDIDVVYNQSWNSLLAKRLRAPFNDRSSSGIPLNLPEVAALEASDLSEASIAPANAEH